VFRNILINSDAMETLAKLKSESIDLCVTDPPYRITTAGNRGVGGIFDTKKNPHIRSGKVFGDNSIKFSDWLPEVYRVLKPKTHFYFFVNSLNLQEALNEGTKAGFKIHNILIWKKQNATPNKFYMKNSEFIIFFRKGKERWINDMSTKQILEFKNPIGKQKIHPTEKPQDLLEVLVANSSNEKETVLDPFAGSGNLGRACKNLKRNFILIEKDASFFKTAHKNIWR